MPRVPKAKACPFCRSLDSFVECADYGLFYRMCNRCGARGPIAEGEACDPLAEGKRGEANATRAWNVRRDLETVHRAASGQTLKSPVKSPAKEKRIGRTA